MPDAEPFAPASFVPHAGLYEEMNVIGEPTGERVIAGRGERLPASQFRFYWRLVVRPKPDGGKPIATPTPSA